MRARRLAAAVPAAVILAAGAIGLAVPAAEAATGAITNGTGLCLQPAGGSSANSTVTQIVSCSSSSSAQSWTPNSDTTIRTLGKCLDVQAGGTSAGSVVGIYDCNGTLAQQWQIVGSSVRSLKSGRCLAANGMASGSGVALQNCSKTDTKQSWTVPATSNPVISAVANRTGTVGVATGFTPSASGGFGLIDWTATGLPAGMDVNYATGTLLGTPTQAGTFSTTLSATDSRGNSSSTSFTWTVSAATVATSYYVDCSAATNGTGTQSSPWNALASVNAKTFTAGEQILLKRGTTCTGQLAPKGSGSATAPIVIDAYGSGAKPVVAGNGISGSNKAGAAVRLLNQSYWIIQNLKVTNDATTEAWRSGIVAIVDDTSTSSGITIRNNEVEKVMGSSDRNNHHTWFYLSHGIGADTQVDGGTFSGLTIADNYIHDMRGNGVGIYGNQELGGNDNTTLNTFVHVKGNTIERNSNDGIVICSSDAPLISGNVSNAAGTNWTSGNIAGIWGWNDANPTFQYNESYGLQAQTQDSMAWDCDGYITGRCTYQYNYDHDNYGGIFLDCTGCGGGKSPIIIFRGNVSVGDNRNLINSGNLQYLVFVNNIIDSGSTTAKMDFSFQAVVANNIFIGPSGSTLPSGKTYLANTYVGFGAPADDPYASTTSPNLVDGGKVLLGLRSTGGERLQSGSSALTSGFPMGQFSAKSDVWGNTASIGTPNRGAYVGPGVGAQSCVDDGSSTITYTSGWAGGSTSACSSTTDHYSNTAGSTATWTFTGTAFVYYASQAPDNGIASVSIDGGTPVEVNLYGPTKKLGLPVYSSPNLGSGSHTVTVSVSGRADPRSTGTYVSLDKFGASS